MSRGNGGVATPGRAGSTGAGGGAATAVAEPQMTSAAAAVTTVVTQRTRRMSTCRTHAPSIVAETATRCECAISRGRCHNRS